MTIRLNKFVYFCFILEHQLKWQEAYRSMREKWKRKHLEETMSLPILKEREEIDSSRGEKAGT